MLMSIDEGMPKIVSQVFARRARLSSKAIVTAIVLTLAALVAMAIASRQDAQTSLRDIDPVTRISVGTGSVLVPVINR
jgi:hypothetical protein